MTSPVSADLLTARVQGVLDVPLHRFLGMRLRHPERPEDGLVIPVGDAATNNAGVLHGGVATALLDVACYLALLPHLSAEENAVTHDASSSLMRAVPQDAELEVVADVVRRGRSLAFLQARALVGGKPVAIGNVTKSILRPEA